MSNEFKKVQIMEIREIKKSKPQKSTQETTASPTASPTASSTVSPTVSPTASPTVSPHSGDKKPRKLSEEEKQQKSTEEYKQDKFQHIKIIDCNQPVSRVVCECWHCLQGLLLEVEAIPPQYTEAQCPNCGKCAIRLQANKVISITPIPSPWG